MNKNLKKVISAVSALAVSATGLAAFAASYPDVPETADYYQAVTELSALGVINGMDDGTYQPEANVTRAQITKMIVTALGNQTVSAAEAAANKDTQFADVTGSHWAAGFVAVGTSPTASNFINGYSATQFGPEDNVTFAQAIKMLVSALGYTSYAENEGGWPAGYLKYGYSLNLTKGLGNVGNDEQLNRAQVAIIIDNALKCPICVSDGYTTGAFGQQVPKTLVKNGTGDLDGTKNGYQDLLNFAHNSYLVYGRINGTYKTDGTSEPDEVRFNIEKAENWDGYPISQSESGSELITAYKGEVKNADDYLFTYAEAIIHIDDNDEYTLVSLMPYGSSKTVTVDTDYYKKLDTGSSYYSVQMYKDGKKSSYDSYKVENDVEYYINGREASTLSDCATFDEFMESQYVKGNKVGKITFIDATDEGKSSTDGKYDYAMVSYYLDAVVDEISVTDEDAKIWFDNYATGLTSSMDFDFEDEDKEYNLSLDGEPVEVKDLQEGDVLSIAYDLQAGFSDSNTYDIYVSRTTVEGKVSSVYEDKDDSLDDEYTLSDGTILTRAFDNASKLTTGTEYTIYLDHFGKIVKADELATTKKYALLENVYTTSGGSDYAVEVAVDGGNKVEYKVDKDNFIRLAGVLMGTEYSDVNSAASGIDISDKMESRAPKQNRVICYTINSKNELKAKENEGVADGENAYAVPYDTEFNGSYKSSTSKIDSVKVSEAITQFLDVSDYTNGDRNFGALGYADLTEGSTYKGYAYGKTSGEKVYQFVLVTDGVSGYNVSNGMAVFVQTVDTDVDGSSETAVQAYVDGELKTLVLDTDDLDGCKAGDVFFYKLNSDREISDARIGANLGLDESYKTFYQNVVDAEFDLVNANTAKLFADETVEGAFNRNDDIDDCDLLFGAIVESDSNEIKLATKAVLDGSESQTINDLNINRVKSIDIADDATVYVYDYGNSSKRIKDRISVGARGSLRASKYDREAYNDPDDKTRVDFESEVLYNNTADNDSYGQVNFAFVKIVDGDIAEALVIIPDTKKN